MRWVLITAAIFGAFSVIIGAALRHLGDDMNMDSLQIALHYHQLHSVVLLAFGLYALNKPCSVGLIVPEGLFIAGIFLFSGSLYVSELFSWPGLTTLTPLGGISLIAAWFSLILVTNRSSL